MAVLPWLTLMWMEERLLEMETTPRHLTPQRTDDSENIAEHAREEAARIVSDTLAELMGFWNFKPSMGRVWTVLYLSPRPLRAEEICEETELSKGSISMTLSDLLEWQVVRQVSVGDDRRRHFEACTDIVGMITRVFEKRELELVTRAVTELERAHELLEKSASSSVPSKMLHTRFLATRVGNLLQLARGGRRVVEQMARVGSLDLRGIRGALRGRRVSS
jgi:DNA-binding transcriptional regulator GbsR (MarR family)